MPGATSDAPQVALADYVARMKPGQEQIYYITAETYAAAKDSPHLEIFRKKGVEVLLMVDRIDEWLVMHLTEFDGKPLVSVAKGNLDLGKLEDADERKQHEQAESEYKELTGRVQKALGERVHAVRVTHRLTGSPACLVVEQNDMSVHLGRLLKAAGQPVPSSKPILEINPTHPIVQRLKGEADEKRFADWSHLLFDQSLLSEGGQLEDPAGFVRRMNELLLMLAPPK